MKKIPVAFKDARDVVKFVDMMNHTNFDIDLKSGVKLVDAKSIMGVMALSKCSSLELILHTDNCEDLLKQLEAVVSLKYTA